MNELVKAINGLNLVVEKLDRNQTVMQQTLEKLDKNQTVMKETLSSAFKRHCEETRRVETSLGKIVSFLKIL